MKLNIAKRVMKRALNKNQKWLRSKGGSTKKYGNFKINRSPNWTEADVIAARAAIKSLKAVINLYG